MIKARYLYFSTLLFSALQIRTAVSQRQHTSKTPNVAILSLIRGLMTGERQQTIQKTMQMHSTVQLQKWACCKKPSYSPCADAVAQCYQRHCLQSALTASSKYRRLGSSPSELGLQSHKYTRTSQFQGEVNPALSIVLQLMGSKHLGIVFSCEKCFSKDKRRGGNILGLYKTNISSQKKTEYKQPLCSFVIEQ